MSSAAISLSPYNPHWPEAYEQERDALAQCLSIFISGGIEHVGSTAVPGMVAKPVIDIMIGVQDLVTSKPTIDILSNAGYCYYPYKADVMHWFCKPSPEIRTHHVHVVPFKSALWYERLMFRDALRADANLAQAYANLKKDLAKQYAQDRETYTQAKTDFIQQVLNSVQTSKQTDSGIHTKIKEQKA